MKVITIGRDESNDVVVHDPCASRHHLQIIQHDDGHFTLADFGSTNGTFINGQKVSGEVYLNMNDIVRIGNSTIPWRLYFEEEDEQEVIQYINVASQYDDVEGITSNPTIPKAKERHGFVTFWLWLMIVGNFIGIIGNGILSPQEMNRNIDTIYYCISENPETFNMDSNAVDTFHHAITLHADMFFISLVLWGICSIIFVILIMRWKKAGFWCWAGTTLIFCVIIAILANSISKDIASLNLPGEINLGENIIPLLIGLFIGILVLWAILQIKKNGVSCWKQLE